MVTKDYCYYKKLCSYNYEEVVQKLNVINGLVEKDYFGRLSYQNYITNHNRKNIKKNKLKKRKEGLWVHHVKEDEQPNLSCPKTIRKYSIDFSYQEKENIVYCDLVEHLILHALIEKNTTKKSDIHEANGFLTIYGQFQKWYIVGEHSVENLKPFKDAIKLSISEAKKLAELVMKIAAKETEKTVIK